MFLDHNRGKKKRQSWTGPLQKEKRAPAANRNPPVAKAVMALAQKVLLEKSLSDFDLSDDAIADIVRSAHVSAALVTNPADPALAIFPANARGLVFYIHIIGGLRKWLLTQPGWVSRVRGGLEFVEHKERKIRIGYVATTEATGGAGDMLLSSRPRGPASRAVVAQNRQLSLPYPELSTPANGDEGWESWFVCVYKSRRVYRVELAFPTQVAGGHLSGWSHRIPVADVPLDSEPKLPTDGSRDGAPPMPRFKVRRKGARPSNDT